MNSDLEETSSTVISSQHLEDKIRRNFAGKIQVLHSSGVKKVIAPIGITTIDESFFITLKEQDILQSAASILHNEIMKIEKFKHPDNITSHRLYKVNVPCHQQYQNL